MRMREVYRMIVSRGIAWAATAAFAIGLLVSAPVWAADNAQKTGIVDLARVYKDAPRIKQYKEELDALTETLKRQLDIRSQNLMLDEAQVKELIELKMKPADKLTDKEKARIDELAKIERDLDATFKQLQSTAQPDEAQKAKLKELQEIERKSKTTGEALENDYNSRLQTKAIELEEKARTDILDAVKKVAEAKGLAMVIAKDAVLFGGADVTDEVINKLDRKVQ